MLQRDYDMHVYCMCLHVFDIFLAVGPFRGRTFVLSFSLVSALAEKVVHSLTFCNSVLF